MKEEMTAREIQAALAKPFAPEDLEWRLQQVNEEKPWGIAVPYVTNRAIQSRLDDVVGPENWYNDYKPWHGSGKKEAQICGISIFFEGKGFITKWDGAEDTDIEPVKGGLSDSMKRAAVQWGIGRVLYNMDAVFVDVEKRGKSWYIAKKEQAKLDKAYLDTLQKLGLTPAAQEKKPAPAPKNGTPPQPAFLPKPEPAAKNTEAAPQTEQPTPAAEYEYKILAAKVQSGMSSASTQLVLGAPDGKKLNAFVRGAHPELTPGTLLTGTRLTMKQQDTVVFYILENYQVMSLPQAA